MNFATQRPPYRCFTSMVTNSTYQAMKIIHYVHRPMSHISAIFGTDDDMEILTSLYLIVNVSLLMFVEWERKSEPMLLVRTLMG